MKSFYQLSRYSRTILALSFSLGMIATLFPTTTTRAQEAQQFVYVPFVSHMEPPPPSLDGRMVLAVYEHINVQVTSDIVTMNPDGSDRLQITNAAEGTIHETPVWSPDGTRIAFAHYNRRGTERGIYVINADGSNRVRLTNSDGMGYDHAPSWSPDGFKIAYHTTNDNIPQIIVINSDGSDPQQLTSGQTSQTPHWSPDGTKILFESNQYELGNAKKEIYVMNADGSNQTRLTFNTETDDGNPRWSPDGAKIAFWSLRGGAGGTYIMDADGSNVTQVANMTESVVNWSPDGTKFTFVAKPDTNTNTEVYMINTDGTGLDVVTETDDLLEDTPHWRP